MTADYLKKTKQNYLNCMTEDDIVQGWDKASFNPFHTTEWFWCRNLRFSYLFHDISHLLFTAWAWSPVAPSDWVKSNDVYGTWLSQGPWEFSEDDFITAWNKVLCCMWANQVVFWPDNWLCPISWLISLCSIGTYENPEFYFLENIATQG